MRRLALGLMLVIIASACGDNDPGVEPTTDSGTGPTPTTTAIPTPTTTTTTTTVEEVDLASVVLSSELTERGMAPVAGESGEVTTDILPAGSALRTMLEGFGVAEGYAAVFATEDGGETIAVAAVRFDTAAGAADAQAEVERIRSEIDSVPGPVILAATGEPLLGSCASIDRVQRSETIVTLWLNTTECHTWDEESPTTEIDCPAELAVGDTAEAIVTVPSHYEPLSWQTDADNFYWSEDYQLVLGEQTVTGEEIRVSISVTEERSVEGTDADLRAILFTYSDIPAFGGTYRISGPRVEATCTISIVAASS